VTVPDPRTAGRFHYAGVAGSGMSALAQFQAMLGGAASGSDRAFDRGGQPEARARLERLGIAIHPQDGSGVDGAAVVVASSAVEADVPDLARARALGVPIVHRSELLAHFVASFRSIAVAGTSGKSTVVAMIFEILRGAGRSPSVITGGDLVCLQAEGLWGNAWFGGDPLVVEADESDGSLVRYAPQTGVLLNLQRDHREVAEVAEMFATFRKRTRGAFVVGEDENLEPFARDATVFGTGPHATLRPSGVWIRPDESRFDLEGVRFLLKVPGKHNVSNALAAIAACRTEGVPLDAMTGPLERFQGVGRRFQVVGRVFGTEVVDDFAHNPAKITAAIETAKKRGRRVIAVYQPHGYGPTRFLRADLVDAFAGALDLNDRLWLLEVFYAGGTTTREALVEHIVAEAQPLDLVLVMGARDPSLSDLARTILEALGRSTTSA